MVVALGAALTPNPHLRWTMLLRYCSPDVMLFVGGYSCFERSHAVHPCCSVSYETLGRRLKPLCRIHRQARTYSQLVHVLWMLCRYFCCRGLVWRRGMGMARCQGVLPVHPYYCMNIVAPLRRARLHLPCNKYHEQSNETYAEMNTSQGT